MRYACLVYIDETKLDTLSDTERVHLRRESIACEDDLRRSGHLVAAESFESVRAATTVRVREGRPITVDGPATQSDEQLSRLLVVEARDLNEAMRLAGKLPSVRLGSIEIRPLRSGRGNAGVDDG